jgi:hypothetical protein
MCKHQRSSKPQAGKGASAHRLVLTYPFVANTSLFLNEIPDDTAISKHPFDLEERTARFGEAIVRFSKKILRDPANNPFDRSAGWRWHKYRRQLLRSQRGSFDERLSPMISRCVKESKEAKFFLRMIAASEPQLAAEAHEHYREAKELHLIFASIFRKTKSQPLYGGRRQSRLKVED